MNEAKITYHSPSIPSIFFFFLLLPFTPIPFKTIPGLAVSLEQKWAQNDEMSIPWVLRISKTEEDKSLLPAAAVVSDPTECREPYPVQHQRPTSNKSRTTQLQSNPNLVLHIKQRPQFHDIALEPQATTPLMTTKTRMGPTLNVRVRPGDKELEGSKEGTRGKIEARRNMREG
ncbi:hypothetical protein EV361DRAFT_873049 [Lentinula raphanica]|nr:hypothetical protein EV361DRAFT_873049 [Lentinula raphanica]